MENAVLNGILQAVEKPARYTGGEWNMVFKQSARLHIALCFPDVYEIGMSHLGSRILYHVLNAREPFFCERVFAPWPDMEGKLREAGLPVFGLESRRPLGEFDLIGFSLLYELCYTNILTMLELSGIPFLAQERGEEFPLVLCGGPCACNPEPLADIVDAVMIGDGEELFPEVADIVLQAKEQGLSKRETLLRLSQVEGVYVPSFYEASYAGGLFAGIRKVEPAAPDAAHRRVVRDLEHAPYLGAPIVPNLGIVHDRVALELFRGCTRGCRFCQAGYIYRPVRERKAETLREMARELVACTGYDEVSLFSLSSSDYSQIHELVPQLMDDFEQERVSLSLPSLRVDRFIKDDLERMQSVRKSGLTFAPEAGTQRLRDVINKGVTEEDLLRVARESFESGWAALKLYFMIGLPTETDEDILGIAELAAKVRQQYYALPKEQRSKGFRLTVSVSSFVPKPCTPFQWCAQDTLEEIKRKQRLLADAIRPLKGVEFRYHDPDVSILEAVFSRGDRRLARALIEAYCRGCRFDSWAEHFKPRVWAEVFEACGLNPGDYAHRVRPVEEPLPWGHLHMLVQQEYLVAEYKKAMAGEITPDCRQGCNGCFGEDYAHLCQTS